MCWISKTGTVVSEAALPDLKRCRRQSPLKPTAFRAFGIPVNAYVPLAHVGQIHTACYVYKHKPSDGRLLVFWDKSAVPSNGNETMSEILTTSKSELTEPVWVDTITGGIYELPMERMIVEGEKFVFKDVPVYDEPTLIADKSLLMP